MFKDTIVSHKLETPMLARFDIGDWSEDGHGIHQEVPYLINYPVADLQQAYKETCRAIGLQFNHNQNFMEPGGENVYDQCLTSYGDSCIHPKDTDLLFKHGILTDERLHDLGLDKDEEGYICIADAEDLAEILMYFIAYSMPDDFSFKLNSDKETPYINGHWGDLNVQFGYGIFCD